ncbi:MAG TPA: hypothetical protein VF226_02795 [Hyphomicrobiaceae bacterium]
MANGLPCIIVAGMGRCGTSLTMQMLEAAGVPCIGGWPDFETDASSIEGFDPSWFAGLSGCAIKLIDPANLPITDMPNHIVVWLDRDPTQQAKSQAKLLKVLGLNIGRSATRTLAADLRNTREKHRARVGVPGGCPATTLRFENMITDPAFAAERLSAFLASYGWATDPEAMAAQVKPRPATCLPGFLEADLLESRGMA